MRVTSVIFLSGALQLRQAYDYCGDLVSTKDDDLD